MERGPHIDLERLTAFTAGLLDEAGRAEVQAHLSELRRLLPSRRESARGPVCRRGPGGLVELRLVLVGRWPLGRDGHDDRGE